MRQRQRQTDRQTATTLSKCEMSKLVGAGRKCQVPRRGDCLD